MSNFHFDDKLSRKVEALYRTPDIIEQRRQVLEALTLTAGERVLDVGSGPGLLAHSMALTVGSKGRVCGIDAKRVDGSDGANATKLPYPEGSFDAAVSTQVYEYVQDVPAALAELHRVLNQSGPSRQPTH